MTRRWINKIVGRFAFSKRLLAWDSYEAHLMDPVKNLLKEMNPKSIIVPGVCTKYIQDSNVVWGKPFKPRIAKFYDKCLASRVEQYTKAGNLKPFPRRLVVTWVLEAWKEISKEMILQPFKGCALTIDDHEISSFKPGKPCANGLTLIRLGFLKRVFSGEGDQFDTPLPPPSYFKKH